MGIVGGYVFPHVCSRCASRKATLQWRMTTPDIPGLKWINSNQRWVHTYSLDVPVCSSCYDSLERARVARAAAMLLCTLLGFAVSSWVLQLLLGSAVNGLLFLLWVFGGMIAGLAFAVFIALPAIDYYLKGQVGRITNNGRSVRFHSRAYQQLFNRMNHTPNRPETSKRIGART